MTPKERTENIRALRDAKSEVSRIRQDLLCATDYPEDCEASRNWFDALDYLSLAVRALERGIATG